jgi:hypothetical protein
MQMSYVNEAPGFHSKNKEYYIQTHNSIRCHFPQKRNKESHAYAISLAA